MSSSKKPIIYYHGWIVLAACFVCSMIIVGGTVYSYQFFVIPITQEYQISRGTVSTAYIALLVGLAIWSPFIGRLLDKIPVQYVFAMGGIAYALGYSVIAMSQQLWVMAAAIFCLVSLSVSCAGGIASNAVTSRWFQKRRGRALGMVSVTSSAGGFIMTPIVVWLLAEQDWRTTLLIIGWVTCLIILVTALIFIRTKPEAYHVAAFDEFENQNTPLASDDAPAMGEEQSWTFKSLLRERNFWFLVLGAGLLLGSDQAMLTSKYPFLIDSGLTSTQAATIISSMIFSAVIGKLVIGYMADYFDIRHLFALVAVFHIGLLLVFLGRPGFYGILAFASVFGAAVGGIYPVWTTLTAKVFGTKSIGLVFGFTAPFMQILSVFFVRFIAEVHGFTGSYDPAFIAFLVTSSISMGLIYLIRLPK
ncbi:MAG: MFS transporter [Parvibaculales bacterium]